MTDNSAEQIERFLSGQMPSEEQKIFEQQLESDKDLLAAYNTYRAIEMHMHKSGKVEDEESLKKNLNTLTTEFFSTSANVFGDTGEKKQNLIREGTRPKSIQLWKLLAAAFLGIIALGIIWQLNNNQNKNEHLPAIAKISKDSSSVVKNHTDSADVKTDAVIKERKDPGLNNATEKKIPQQLKTLQTSLFAKYFKPDSPPEDTEGPLEDAFDIYEKGLYKKAVKAFESADVNEMTRAQQVSIELTTFYAAYYKGISYLAADNAAKALSTLNKATSSDPLLDVKAKWYLALACLKSSDTSRAAALLKLITENPSAAEYKTMADGLLTDLRGTK